MHDIDSVRLESEFENEGFETGPFEYEQFEYGEAESPYYGEAESVFGEAEEMELASEMLEVMSEDELDQFLGSVIKKAGRVLGGAVKPAATQAIGGLLKGAVKKAVPSVGSLVGGYLGGATGRQIGSQAAATAGRLFGLELEGLSSEDQEYEVARRFIRFASQAVKNLTRMPGGQNVRDAARAATVAAAKQLAPGLLQAETATTPPQSSLPPTGTRGQSGRWMRRGNKIVLLGL